MSVDTHALHNCPLPLAIGGLTGVDFVRLGLKEKFPLYHAWSFSGFVPLLPLRSPRPRSSPPPQGIVVAYLAACWLCISQLILVGIGLELMECQRGVCLEISSPSLRRAFPSRSLTIASFIFVGSLVGKNDSVRPYSSDTTGAAPHVTGNASVLEHGVCLKESSRRPGGSCVEAV